VEEPVRPSQSEPESEPDSSPHGASDAPQATTAPPTPWERVLPYLKLYGPLVAGTAWLARTTTRTILARAGGPAVPLDDAYIHFQYARSLAHGHFFSFIASEGYTSGATSLLWPAMLAPFYLIGFHDTSIIWIAWLFGWLFLGLLVLETKRLAQGMMSEANAIAAGICTLVFGGYTWFAASGMEVTPLAYALARTARLASEWQEAPDKRTRSQRNHLIALAILGPLIRPEGAICSAIVALTLVLFSSDPQARLKDSWKLRAWGLIALLGPVIHPLLNKLFTGHAASSTTMVKWLPLNPYYTSTTLWYTFQQNYDTFVRTLLDGKEWSAIFIPKHSMPYAIAALAAIPMIGGYKGRWYRMFLVLLLCISMLIPITYMSFLWNRLRYLWPFSFAWCIGIGCLGQGVGELLSHLRPRLAAFSPLVGGVAAGLLAHHLDWTMDDVATSSYAIHNQQVKLARWAKENLPANARIGVNDTGAIGYLSDRTTFDVVGLTTPQEAKYWVAGAGSRYEHYERLQRETPNKLPTHFIVYPHWMACEPVLGEELTRATVRDQTILGGNTMIAYKADYLLLNSGEYPIVLPKGKLLDSLDISDLESEQEHALDVLGGWASDPDNRVETSERPDGQTIADAGRHKRTVDRFLLRVPSGKAVDVIGRWATSTPGSVTIVINGKEQSRVHINAVGWTEETIHVPAADVRAENQVEVRASSGHSFTSFHYWAYESH
jgi:hypothetical protein